MKNHEQNNDQSDLTLVLKDYEDKWVVLSQDKKKVLASGDSFDAIVDMLAEGFALKVPKFIAYAPHSHN